MSDAAAFNDIMLALGIMFNTASIILIQRRWR